jgi:hypothetical protein
MKFLTRLVREPVVHFLVIGGLVFALYAAVSGPAPEPAEKIVVGPDRIAQLAKSFEAVWRRAPNDSELAAVVDDFVRQEIYYREALTLGLDRDDTVIRRRLRQKMEFLSDTGAELLEPTEAELEAYFRDNEEVFRRQPRLTFEQIYLGETPAAGEAERLLAELRTKAGAAADPSTLGVHTLLPGRLDQAPPRSVDGAFGQGFFDRLAALTPGAWQGPMKSSYGVHLIRIVESAPAVMPPFATVRDAVLRHWKAAKARELRERHFEQLRQRYLVEVDGVPDTKGGGGQ